MWGSYLWRLLTELTNNLHSYHIYGMSSTLKKYAVIFITIFVILQSLKLIIRGNIGLYIKFMFMKNMN